MGEPNQIGRVTGVEPGLIKYRDRNRGFLQICCPASSSDNNLLKIGLSHDWLLSKNRYRGIIDNFILQAAALKEHGQDL